MGLKSIYKGLTAGLVPLKGKDGAKVWINPERVLTATPMNDGTTLLHMNDNTDVVVMGEDDQVLSQLGLVDRVPRDREAAPPEPRANASRRDFVLKAATGEIRTAQHEGREFLVLPIVGMVEGVIWPINAPKPEFVPAESFTGVPQGWNGRPVFCGHPVNADGNQVSGNTPDKLGGSFGTVFNARTDGKRLLMEAWLDVEKARTLGGDALKALERARSGAPVEVSIGAFVVTQDVAGSFQGRKYDTAWAEVFPDHLALLPEGDEGACSVRMGCGVRAAKVHTIAQNGIQWDGMPNDAKTAPTAGLLKRLGQFLRAMHGYDGECGLGQSDLDKRHEIQEALERLEPERRPMVEAVYDEYVVYCCDGPDGPEYYQRAYMTDAATGEVAVSGDAVKVEPVMHYEPMELTAAKGARHSQKDMALVQAMHDHSVELGATCAPKAAATRREGDAMKREEKIKALRAAMLPCRMAELEAAAKAQSKGDILEAIVAQIVEKLGLSEEAAADLENLSEATLVELAGLKAPAPKEEKSKDGSSDNTPGADAKVPPPSASASYSANAGMTAEQFLAAAPQEIKDIITAAKASEQAKKDALVGTLKTAQAEYKEDELKAMSVKELERLVRACRATVPEVDYSGQAPRNDEPAAAAPAPPDMGELIRKRNGGK